MTMTVQQRLKRLAEIGRQVDNNTTDRLNREKPTKYSGTKIPLADQLIALNCQRRAQEHYNENILPSVEYIAECDELEEELAMIARKTGAPEAYEQLEQNDKNRRDAKYDKSLKDAWTELKSLRRAYMEEGLSPGQYRRAFGALCGRFELMPETVVKAGQLDLDSVKMKHILTAINDVQDEIDRESNRNPEGSPGYTAKVDGDDRDTDVKQPKMVGDDTEKDTDDLLKTEWKLKDEQKKRLESRARNAS